MDRENNEPEDAAVSRVARLVEGEARRVLSEEQFVADPQLVAQGWERRFMTDGRKAAEAEESYRQLGYEVLLVPVEAEELDDDCSDCQLLMQLQFKNIYTRKRRV